MKLRRIAEIALLAGVLGGWAGCSGDEETSIVRTPTQAPPQPTDTRTPTAEPTAVPPTNTATAVAPPTSTQTATTTSTAAQATPTPTATGGPPTELPTDTPTATPTVEEATPTPTTGGGALGVRALTVMRPGSHFNSSALAGFDVSLDPWLPGPILLEAGAPDGSGNASLKLMQDAVLGCPVLDNSVFCVKLFAEGSTGTVSCNGGVPHGVDVSRDSHQDENPGPLIILTGQGADSPPGSASMTLTYSFVNLPVGADPSDCETADFSVVEAAATTTAGAMGTILNPVQGGAMITIAGQGVPFDCADWTNPDGPGTLITPILGLDIEPVGDVANLLVTAGQQETE